MKFVASVVTNDGTFRPTVISPLIAPTPADDRECSDDREHEGHPLLWSQYMTHGQNRKTWPAERSISASTSSSTSPTAIAPIGPA